MIRYRSQAGDPAARRVINDTGRYLCVAVGHVLSILGCSRVLLAGSIGNLGDELLAAVRAEMLHRTVSPVAEESSIGFAAIDADMVLRGASALVLSQELGLLSS